jgi:hypothetical protein
VQGDGRSLAISCTPATHEIPYLAIPPQRRNDRQPFQDVPLRGPGGRAGGS